jgi:basic membrane protein A
VSVAAAIAGRHAVAQRRLSVAALFAGSIDDGGFMQAGYEGLIRARDRFGIDVSFRQGVPPAPDRLEAALRDLASASPDLVIAHGGQNNAAAMAVAAAYPALRFVVTQGNVVGANLSSYEVLQEHSAFLAGALAGLVTRTGVVGHMSGIRVVPGLKGRAAYAAGVRMVNPQARLLTNFSGSQDDPALAQRVATAMLDQRADIIFTMLNAGRSGAIAACRERHAMQIGNVIDWVARMPDIFIGSAVADSGAAVLASVEDLVAGRFPAAAVKQIGLERPDAVRLAVRSDVPAAAQARIAGLSDAIIDAKLAVPSEWSGTEFATPG